MDLPDEIWRKIQVFLDQEKELEKSDEEHCESVNLADQQIATLWRAMEQREIAFTNAFSTQEPDVDLINLFRITDIRFQRLFRQILWARELEDYVIDGLEDWAPTTIEEELRLQQLNTI